MVGPIVCEQKAYVLYLQKVENEYMNILNIELSDVHNNCTKKKLPVTQIKWPRCLLLFFLLDTASKDSRQQEIKI